MWLSAASKGERRKHDCPCLDLMDVEELGAVSSARVLFSDNRLWQRSSKVLGSLKLYPATIAIGEGGIYKSISAMTGAEIQ